MLFKYLWMIIWLTCTGLEGIPWKLSSVWLKKELLQKCMTWERKRAQYLNLCCLFIYENPLVRHYAFWLHYRKLIGARYYNIPLASNENKASPTKATGSPRDFEGHGTHTASTAAGASVVNASYYGLARGTARGGSPSVRIAGYKACSEEGCTSSTILKAIDDAIKDGVDIISISIGMNSLFQSDYLTDPIAIGAFHAEQMGVLVVCSAGNEGPDPYTIVNTAPWIFTVAASNIDRDFKSTVLLGNGKTYQVRYFYEIF